MSCCSELIAPHRPDGHGLLRLALSATAVQGLRQLFLRHRAQAWPGPRQPWPGCTENCRLAALVEMTTVRDRGEYST